MNLRHFLYRDDSLVEEFLSQVEGGVFDEVQETRREEGGAPLGDTVALDTPTEAGSSSHDQSREESRRIRQTGASRFERLHRALGDDLQYLETVDEDGWTALRRGEPLEVEVTLSLVGIGRLADLLGAFEDLLPLMQSLGGEGVDPETAEAISSFQGLASTTAGSSGVVAAMVGSPRYKFACDLKTDNLLVSEDELVGEATIVGKLRRKLRPDERHLIPSVFGGLESMMPDQDQDEFANFFDTGEARQLGLASPMLEHPAALVTPIAVFR